MGINFPWFLVKLWIYGHKWLSSGLELRQPSVVCHFSNFFSSETASQSKPNFIWSIQLKTETRCIPKNVISYSRWPPRAYMERKKPSKIFSRTKEQVTLSLGMKHRYTTGPTKFVQIMMIDWPLTLLWKG